ncbi:MAG: hypothetical protein HY554_16355 [Elusimicrobia bacterium]|nr:hypothetical protein [Elusimicrobiota bacterium]
MPPGALIAAALFSAAAAQGAAPLPPQEPCPAAFCADSMDIGLRTAEEGSRVVPVAVQGPRDGPSPLRVFKNGRTYSIALVPVGSVNATAIRVGVPDGVCAVRRYTDATLTANPRLITAGESVTLAYAASDARTLGGGCALNGGPCPAGVRFAPAAGGGSQTLTLPTPGLYRFTLDTGDACKVSSVEIDVDGVPYIETFSASPNPATTGGGTALTWTARHCASIETSGTSGFIAGCSSPAGGLLRSEQPGTYTYTLQVRNRAGVLSEKRSVAVSFRGNRVFLSGSRVWADGETAIEYSYWTLLSSHVQAMVSAAGPAAQGLAAFAADLSRNIAGQQNAGPAHVAGQTEIMDENGRTLGSMDTLSLFGVGLPGLIRLGDPYGTGYNELWAGSAALSFGGIEYEVVGFASVSPIILDLDGNGTPDVDRGEWLPHPARFNRKRAVLFDINADGFLDVTEWIGAGDGLLVAPLGRRRSVKGGDLFGNPIGFLHGYHKLALSFDRDRDGAVKGAELEGLQVWRDSNGDGRTDPGELKTVQELGITSIGARQENMKSRFTMRGEERASWDWWPTSMMVYPKPAARLPRRREAR